MTDTVLVIGGAGQLGAPVVGQLRGDGYRSGRWRDGSHQPATATQVWSTSKATWMTLTRCAARLLAVPRCT